MAQATVAAAVARQVHCDQNILYAGGIAYDLSRYSEVCIISIGKAGATLFDAIDVLLPSGLARCAMVCAPSPPQRVGEHLQYFAGGHPEPNGASLAAARAALDAVRACASDALVLLLISGGASAMCELPLSDTVSLDDLIALNRLLIGSGASIAEINAVRKHFSRIKGGRLALAAGERDKLTLLISDVPDTALDALGSGPSLPDTSTVADCLAVLDRFGLLQRLPPSFRALIDAGLEETPKADAPAFRNAHAAVLLGNATILEEAARAATALGYVVTVDNSCDDQEYRAAADYLLGRLAALQGEADRVCLLSGGEVTVLLPDSPGVGGRNQQFCLHCAAVAMPPNVTILSAGTDGIDGHSDAAGAVVDATTQPRGRGLGFAMQPHLDRCDAGTYLAAVGDTIVTGPTGNNLRDVRILLSNRAEH